MRRMSKVWWALFVGVSLGVTLAGVSPVKAAPLSNTPISWTTFLNFAEIGSPVVDSLYDHFDFEPVAPGHDGLIYSQVFEGKGDAAGKFVYVYQVKHFSGSSSQYFRSFSFKSFSTLMPINLPGIGNSFYISFADDPDDITIGFGLGSKAPVSFWYDPNFLTNTSSVSVDFKGGSQPGIGRGEVSFIFGFVHELPPVKAKVNPMDDDPDALKPLVYTPSPEPTSFVLLSAGLLGLVAIRRRRFEI